MFKLQQLRDNWVTLDGMLRDRTLEEGERQALETSAQMMAALVIQLESQSISFTP
jgi:hypothetical protein